ncbi:segregation/condensation protein A [Texcoconibacillus texcoconensis]|uniref:Segregation and condensation protein A n=1 Tax=Texcoconibacillus texcoconensis TaxID=1095777 RepID=A0A840QNM4_9BACI|nr:segregation/condensation protein A [Texcoconibacillus texcoconensis]MBB5172969.1 segregation and condensation protein A [Texcoconibacillus texcoconensis]
MEYSVKIDRFEGPLDLLLHLIQKNDLDIYDIPVAEITDQYLSYIHTMQVLQLDIASEYLVMAATLVEMKSRMLLPVHEDELDDQDWLIEEDEEDPREALMHRLLEYRRFKEAAEGLKVREQERSEQYSKPVTNLEPYIEEETNKNESINASLYDMLDAFQKMLQRKVKSDPAITTVPREEISIEDRMGEIMDTLSTNGGKQSFNKMFVRSDRSFAVVTFLAILELMKGNVIQCEQSFNFEDIIIYKTGGESL